MKLSSEYAEKLRQAFGIEILQDTPLEEHCKKTYRLVPNIAYKDKRKHDGQGYPVFLNEMLTPGAWMVKNLLRGVLLTGDTRARVRNVGNIVARRLTWTDDKNLDASGDYYLYPSEVLRTGKGDCEDHAFVMSSALPEDLAVAYGFRDDGQKPYGHAYNLMLEDGKLYAVDTVGNSVEIEELTPQSKFTVHYIITQRYTFEVRAGTRFGDLAGWER